MSASYYLFDGSLSVRALTDEAGAVTDTLVFDAFGNETEKTGTTDNAYGFQGEEKDATGLYYLRARYMDPASGTFTSMDTYAGSLSDPMSLHKYLFANSNPVMYSDPSGYSASLSELGVSMAIGAILSGVSYSAIWGITALYDGYAGTNYSKNFSWQNLIVSVIMGAFLGGIGWEFSTFFQILNLTRLQFIGLSVICALVGLDLKYLSYQSNKSGDILWSAIFSTLGDVALVGMGASAASAVSAGSNPLKLDNSTSSSSKPNTNNSGDRTAEFYEYKALREQGYTASEAYELMKQFRNGSNPNSGFLFHFTTYEGGRGITSKGGIRSTEHGMAGPGVYCGTTPKPSGFLKHAPGIGWGLGKTPVRIPIRITPTMTIKTPKIIPIKTKVIVNTDFHFFSTGA